MRRVDCEFEHEALAAVLEGRWPDAVDAALRKHAAECPICAEVVAAATAMRELREQARAATVPDSGFVWRSAQMRARREAAKAASRPITAVQVIALACCVGLLGAFFGATSTWLQAAVKKGATIARGVEVASLIPQTPSFLAGHGLLILAAGALLLLIPAAVCAAMLRD
jgi:predicted anti-sigma-YlaC factor YlaD